MITRILVLLLFCGSAHAQTFNLFRPANGILKGQTTTYVTTAAAASDVISLWSGSCSSTTFLRGDGSCQAPGGAGIGTVTSVAMTWASSGISIGGSPITSAGTLALTGTLNVATGGTGATTLTGLLEGNGTSAIDPAESADVITLWTGTCNATTFLRADGSCQSAAGTSANPTATVGPTATNGVATTFMRSDGAPAINLSTAYSWAGQHTHTGVGSGVAAPILLSSVSPTIGFSETDATTDNAVYDIIANSEALNFRLLNNANTLATTFIKVDRTLNVADSIAFTTTAMTLNGSAMLTTASSLPAASLTGTVADARLSANVALKNVANQTFSAVGNTQLTLSNTSTGYGVVAVQTNGTQRIDMCSSSTAGECGSTTAANDSAIRFDQKLHLVDTLNTANNVIATFDTAQIDLNATVVNANSSRINTVANTGKVAYGLIDATTGSVSRSLNVTSGTRTGTGAYTVNVTAAGFSVVPSCVASVIPSAGPTQFYIAGANAGVSTTSVVLASSVIIGSPLTLTAADAFISFICNGT